MAVALGAGLAVLPAVASSETAPTVEAVAVSSGLYPEYAWRPAEVTIGAGGSVTFTNNSSAEHGIVWESATTPTCDSGVPVGIGKAALKWSGACTFAQAGTYKFRCSVHEYMHGSIVVSASGTTSVTTTATTTTPSGTTNTTTTTTTTPTALESPLAGPASSALRMPKSQRGGSVRGSIQLSQAAAGGRLEVDLLAPRASLAKRRHAAPVRVGRLVRNSLSSGKLTFSVRLNSRAQRAIKRHRRLALMVKVIVTPASGKPVTLTRSVVEHV